MNCLNCHQLISGKFCENCGQKTNTKRFSLKQILTHDFIHSFFHVDSGIFFTLKELFTRPGHSIREYVQGERKKHFNYITLLLLTIALGHLLEGYSSVHAADLMSSETSGKMMEAFEKFASKYPKLVVFTLIPLNALSTFIWFRKKINFAESFVMNSYKTVFDYLMGILFSIITILYTNIEALGILFTLVTFIQTIYAFVFHYQYFSKSQYSKTNLILKVFGTVISVQVFVGLIGVVFGIVLKVFES